MQNAKCKNKWNLCFNFLAPPQLKLFSSSPLLTSAKDVRGSWKTIIGWGFLSEELLITAVLDSSFCPSFFLVHAGCPLLSAGWPR